jgi:hypothetical protein
MASTPSKTPAADSKAADKDPAVTPAPETAAKSTSSDLGTADASVASIPAAGAVQTTADATDPATGEGFNPRPAGAGGRYGFPIDDAPVVGTVPRYAPGQVPSEVTSHVMPDSKDALWAAVNAAAPNLTPEIAEAFGFDDEVLAKIARREIPPPPVNGPIHSTDLYLTPGGWQSVPAGVDPGSIGQNKISR